MTGRRPTPFNSALEVGLRALIILVEAYPAALDLQRLVQFDYIALHSEDAGGPRSLHPPLPLRSGELTVRRRLVEGGLLLMISRGLIARIPSETDGIVYQATDAAGPFVSNLHARYTRDLRASVRWTIASFGDVSGENLRALTSSFYRQWSSEFETVSATQPLGEA